MPTSICVLCRMLAPRQAPTWGNPEEFVKHFTNKKDWLIVSSYLIILIFTITQLLRRNLSMLSLS